MRIGFDISALRHGVRGGIAVYTRSLARALLEREEVERLILFFCARESSGAEEALVDLEERGCRIVRGPAPWRWFPDGGWWLPREPRIERLLGEVDVFHAGEFLVPRTAKTPVVATVQDLTTVLFPQHHHFWNRWRDRRRLGWVAERATRVLVPSVSTARDVSGHLGISRERIDVALLAAGEVPEGGPGREPADDPDAPLHILFVGTLEPRKNVERLVRAFTRIAPHHADVRLVLVGPAGWRGGPLARLLRDSPVRDRIDVTGFLPSEELRARYHAADIFAYPSLYEGFGLPVLEAMTIGTPVLTSDVSSLPEVVGEAAVFVDPTSVGSVAEGLDRLLSDPALRRDLARRGRARAADFSWEHTARRTVECYRRAIESPGARP